MTTTEMSSTTKTYLSVFGALAVLTVVTVWVSYFDLSRTGAIALALFIATVKVSLIVFFFMHLKSEKKTIHQILFTALVLVLLLLLLVLPDIGFNP